MLPPFTSAATLSRCLPPFQPVLSPAPFVFASSYYVQSYLVDWPATALAHWLPSDGRMIGLICGCKYILVLWVDGPRLLVLYRLIGGRDLLRLMSHETISGNYPNHLVTTNVLIKKVTRLNW